MTRFDRLLARYKEKKNGSINDDLMVVIYSKSKVDGLRLQLHFAELELEHAIRGLDHRDYDSVFEGWERCDGTPPGGEVAK